MNREPRGSERRSHVESEKESKKYEIFQYKGKRNKYMELS